MAERIPCSNLPVISDIYQMEIVSSATGTYNPPQTKQCPFCAETIQARAIKCRFCNEFLNTNRAKTLEAGSDKNSQSEKSGEKMDGVLFAGKPSLFGMVGAVIRGLFFLAVAGFLIYYPLEELLVFQPAENSASAGYSELVEEDPSSELIENQTAEKPWFGLTEQQALVFGKYRIVAGIGLVTLVMLILLMKMVKLKMTRYEVSAERIEWSRGILDRKVDNLDMFRVIDLRLRRSLLDCIVGVGTVVLITTDKTDPEFTFEKIRNSRRLYDIIKKASLDADHRNSVVHLE